MKETLVLCTASDKAIKLSVKFVPPAMVKPFFVYQPKFLVEMLSGILKQFILVCEDECLRRYGDDL